MYSNSQLKINLLPIFYEEDIKKPGYKPGIKIIL